MRCRTSPRARKTPPRHLTGQGHHHGVLEPTRRRARPARGRPYSLPRVPHSLRRSPRRAVDAVSLNTRCARAMQHDAWSWPVQSEAQLPEARRQPRLWPSAVLADVPGWGGFEAQPARGGWPRQAGSGTEAPAQRLAAPDADEQQLAEQVRCTWRVVRPRRASHTPASDAAAKHAQHRPVCTAQRSFCAAKQTTARICEQSRPPLGWRGGAALQQSRHTSTGAANACVCLASRPCDVCGGTQHLVAIRRTVFIRDIDQEVRSTTACVATALSALNR